MEVESLSGFTKAFQEFQPTSPLTVGLRPQGVAGANQSYLSGLLLQCEEQRSAEKLSGMVPVKAKSMRRFLTEVRISLEKETSVEPPRFEGPNALAYDTNMGSGGHLPEVGWWHPILGCRIPVERLRNVEVFWSIDVPVSSLNPSPMVQPPKRRFLRKPIPLRTPVTVRNLPTALPCRPASRLMPRFSPAATPPSSSRLNVSTALCATPAGLVTSPLQ